MININFLPLFFIFICIPNIFSQKNEYILTEFGDTYVAEININEKIFNGINKCLTGKKEKYSLYNMDIKKIYYMPKQSVFDSSSLMKVKYILIKKSTIFKGDTNYYVTLKPSTNYEYVVFNRILDIDNPNNIEFIHKKAYLSGFISCKKRDPFYKYIYNLNNT